MEKIHEKAELRREMKQEKHKYQAVVAWLFSYYCIKKIPQAQVRSKLFLIALL